MARLMGAKLLRRLTCASKKVLYVVFISYSRKDWLIASTLAKMIREIGAEVWLDENKLAGGNPVHYEVLEAIGNCDEGLVLFTPYSVHSQWVLFEAGALSGQRKRVTLVLDHVGPKDVPVLWGFKAIDLNDVVQVLLPELARRIGEKILRS
jgi:hypothetical protein